MCSYTGETNSIAGQRPAPVETGDVLLVSGDPLEVPPRWQGDIKEGETADASRVDYSKTTAKLENFARSSESRFQRGSEERNGPLKLIE